MAFCRSLTSDLNFYWFTLDLHCWYWLRDPPTYPYHSCYLLLFLFMLLFVLLFVYSRTEYTIVYLGSDTDKVLEEVRESSVQCSQFRVARLAFFMPCLENMVVVVLIPCHKIFSGGIFLECGIIVAFFKINWQIFRKKWQRLLHGRKKLTFCQNF